MNKKHKFFAFLLASLSFMFVCASPASANSPAKSSADPGWVAIDTSGALLNLDFQGNNYDKSPTGTYTFRTTEMEMNASPGGKYAGYGIPGDTSRLQRVLDAATGNKYLSKLTPAGKYNASQDPTANDKLLLEWTANKQYDSLYLSYRVKAAPGFDFKLGGKLPGLCGGTCPLGGQSATNSNNIGVGWSARNMWRDSDAKLVQYFYYPQQSGEWGIDKSYSTLVTKKPVTINDNKWHTIEHYVKMNTPGKSDGRFMAWVDGKEVLRMEGIRYRDNYNYGIDRLKISSYFGGSDPSWAPTRNSYLQLDDIVVSTKRISH